MRTEFTQIAITAPLLRRVIAPPRLGVVFIAVLLEDHEQVVDVVLDDGVDMDDEGDGEEFDEDLEME